MKDYVYKSQELLVMEKHKVHNLQVKLIILLRVLPMAIQKNVCYSANVTAETCNFSVTQTFPFRKFQRQSIQSCGTGMLLSAIYESSGDKFQIAEPKPLRRLCVLPAVTLTPSLQIGIIRGDIERDTGLFQNAVLSSKPICIKNTLMVTEG